MQDHKQKIPDVLSNLSKTPNSLRSCPYHDPILRLSLEEKQLCHTGIMDRFLLEGPADQPAVFNRPDNGMLSISKGCTCLTKVEKGAARL